MSLKFVTKGPINNIPSLVWMMTRRRPGDKLLSELMMVSLHASIGLNELTIKTKTESRLTLGRKCHQFDDITINGCTMTTCSAASDENFIWMTTFPFQCHTNCVITGGTAGCQDDSPSWQQWQQTQQALGLLPYTQNCGMLMCRECRERFPRHRGLAIPTCITARAWRTCRDACRDR